MSTVSYNHDSTSGPNEMAGGLWTVGARATVGFVFGVIILVGLVGNAVIITVIKREHKLHTRANYLIGSLAMADLLVSLLVSPFSAVMTLHEFTPNLYFVGHHVMCQLFTFLDVTCCTASILHLCAIAHDRYTAVTKLQYRHRTHFKKVLPCIVLIWLAAVLLSVTPYFVFPSPTTGAKEPNTDTVELSPNNFTSAPSIEVMVTSSQIINEGLMCSVNTNKIYRIVATTIAFYAPLVIIIAIYWRVARIAWTRIHHSVSATPSNGKEFHFPSTMQSEEKNNVGCIGKPSQSSPQASKFEFLTFGLLRMKAIRLCCHNDSSESNADELSDPFDRCEKKEECVNFPVDECQSSEDIATLHKTCEKGKKQIMAKNNNCSPPTLQRTAMYNLLRRNSLRHTPRHEQHLQEAFCVLSLGFRPNVTNKRRFSHDASDVDKNIYRNDSVSKVPNQFTEKTLKRSHSHSDVPAILITADDASGGYPAKRNESPQHRVSSSKSEHSVGLLRSRTDNRKDSIAYSLGNQSLRSSVRSTASNYLRTPSQMRSGSTASLHRNTRRRVTLHREKKIIRTMGMVIGAFVACWLPFFIKELIVPFCGEQCHLDPSLEVFINWLGYANSALNPFIYAFSNEEFNKAIRKLFRWNRRR
nr:5-hydroxytryptamine receptor 1A-like [Ciona intestinalis]|eukprot:XP_018668983.1 5-hydroxytryptamine receptor 1A-like [Ciona intestinalis]